MWQMNVQLARRFSVFRYIAGNLPVLNRAIHLLCASGKVNVLGHVASLQANNLPGLQQAASVDVLPLLVLSEIRYLKKRANFR